MKTIPKHIVLEMLHNEHWFPMVHPTNVEMETSKLLNAILDTIASKIEDYE